MIPGHAVAVRVVVEVGVVRDGVDRLHGDAVQPQAERRRQAVLKEKGLISLVQFLSGEVKK